MAISRSNKETFVWLKRIKWKDITQENLVEEADYFFGAVKTKRRQTVQAKLVEFVEKEASLRKTLIFQIMRSRNGEGPRGRSPPLSFKPKDVTLVGFFPSSMERGKVNLSVKYVEPCCLGRTTVRNISEVNISKNSNHCLQKSALLKQIIM